MDFLDKIEKWQSQARKIEPPHDREKARGGLKGPAFFPEGRGLLNPEKWLGVERPRIMVIGHNFGCVGYRNRLDPDEVKRKENGREDDEDTWKHLASLLDEAKMTIGQQKVSIDDCFMTNWFVGLLPGKKNTGPFLVPGWPGEKEYEAECFDLLKQQIEEIQPRLILLMGKVVVLRASQLIPALKCWTWKTKTEPRWASIRSVRENVTIMSLKYNPIVVAGLWHTSHTDGLENNLEVLELAEKKVASRRRISTTLPLP